MRSRVFRQTSSYTLKAQHQKHLMVFRHCPLFTLACFGMVHDLNCFKLRKELLQVIYCVTQNLAKVPAFW